jgi:hypothetical protein
MERTRAGLFAFLFAAGMTVVAGCAMHGAGALPPAPPVAADDEAESAQPAPLPMGRDLGRRAARAPVWASIVLRYRNEDELDRFVASVSEPGSAQFRRFLTPEAFDARFAPSQQQYDRVIAALRASGFTIVRTFPSRALLDARGSSANAERLFATRIHDFDEGRDGKHYANVVALHIPPSISAEVRTVLIDSLVRARPAQVAAAPDVQPDRAFPNVIRNGSFESKLDFWKTCDTVHVSTQHPYEGKHDALIGSLTAASGTVKGRVTMCQQVKVPENATLTAHVYTATNLTSLKEGFVEAALLEPNGKLIRVLYRSFKNEPKWLTLSWDLVKYKGRDVRVAFTVNGHAQKHLYATMFVDGVTLTGSSVSPSPSPTPTTRPTASPIGPGPGRHLKGPVYGPSKGWAPRGIADGLDMPVQHGYDGRKTTAAIVMQSAIDTVDLRMFVTENKIDHRGQVVVDAIDGGPTNGDPHEGMLDMETIVGLAPDTRIIALEGPNLSDQTVLDAFATAMHDKRIDVIVAPFTQCESANTSFDKATEADAIAGAATGKTFVSASGDTGSACFNGSTNVVGAESPAGDPHFLSVGGTESVAPSFTPAPCACPIDNPVAWDDHNVSFGGLTGGGTSTEWPIPTYQAGVLGSPASARYRNVPDISMPGVDADLRVTGVSEAVDGTSWSASSATALLLDAVEICGKVGFVNPAIYKLFARDGEGTSFLDVTSGFNGSYVPALPQGYTAVKDYDDASGIGIPHGFAFAAALCNRT